MGKITRFQLKIMSLMPAPDHSRGQAPAGIQCGGGGEKRHKTWIPACAGMTIDGVPAS
jgi:hypothetical protein